MTWQRFAIMFELATARMHRCQLWSSAHALNERSQRVVGHTDLMNSERHKNDFVHPCIHAIVSCDYAAQPTPHA